MTCDHGRMVRAFDIASLIHIDLFLNFLPFSMFRLSENYYLRKCYFEREQVPTQTVMKNKMTPALANVYFKSMTSKLKVLAGLEPPMKGGGSDWFVPPEELLKGRAVIKPTKKQYLMKLGFNGIDAFGEKLVQDHHKRMEEEKRQVLLENDLNWKKTIDVSCRQQWDDASCEAIKENTAKIQQAFHEFEMMYTTSITKIEKLLFDAAIKEIERVREDAYQKMKMHFEKLLKQQATMLYDRYTEKLMTEKARLKKEFIENVEVSRTETTRKIHDINVEKHIAVEKIRNLLQCQNLACQMYVALKERDECKKEIEISKHEHEKKAKKLNEEMALKDFEIKLEIEKDEKRKEFNTIWQKKICHVVKRFQMFVMYCLKLLPEHAEFFLNMEKLMMMQLDEATENSTAPSVFEFEKPTFHTPVPKPHPFFLVFDKGYKPQFEQNLVPKHCTSSASQLPVIVVNKRFIYAACDNFDQFTDKIKEFVHGRRGENKDFEDDHDYEYVFPIKYTSSEQLLELKLESSLMQILQKELPNIRGLPVECCICKIPYCFCSPLHASMMSLPVPKETEKQPSLAVIDPGKLIESRDVELKHEREPKWESYMEYVEPKKCKCGKTAKKHLKENLPSYMQKMSKYDAPDLPNYEPCSIKRLKELVKRAKGIHTPPPEPVKAESKTKDISTQYSDQEFDYLCTCFSDDEIELLYKKLVTSSPVDARSTQQLKLVDASLSPTYLDKTISSFATDRAFSLRNLMDSPGLEEIFKKGDCKFD